MPELSQHAQNKKPSAIRAAQIEFSKRITENKNETVEAINVAIGNISLPTHPKMQERMFNLDADNSPVKDGAISYSASVGFPETNDAFKNVIAASGFDTSELYSQITDGGSAGMELMILSCCGAAGTKEKPLMLIDAAYANYMSLASRLGRETVSVSRNLENDGNFTLPDSSEIEKMIEEDKPGALVMIPYDNPTGQYYNQEAINEIAKICVKHDIWMVSDEAYRELQYTDGETSSIWGITEEKVPGISGKRISIETTSKVWNACGLRVGALVTDNKEFNEKTIAESTATLCTNVIGQYIFGALANESKEDLQEWFNEQRVYYKPMLESVTHKFKELLPEVIVSNPDASLYSVVDVKNVAKPGFDAADFVHFCASEGKVNIDGKDLTLLAAPMAGFYEEKAGVENPGKTQMRIAYVLSPEKMAIVPELFVDLFKQYEAKK